MLSCVQLFVTLWTVACYAPLSMEFSRQEYWIVLAGEVFTTEPPEKPSTSSLVQIFSCYQSPAMQEAQVQFLGQEDSLEKGMATHSSILAWRIPWTEEPGGLQSMGSQRIRHD